MSSTSKYLFDKLTIPLVRGSRAINNHYLNVMILFGMAVLLTVTAIKLSIHVAHTYYAIGVFHYDSASYIYQSINFYDLLKNHGLLFTIRRLMLEKDSLDILLRVVFAPKQLITLFGHMKVLLPFFCIFIFLLLYYVFKRTQSWISSLIVCAFLFTFPILFSPYMGMADYWKESIAIWILGCAVLCFFLSNLFRKRYWAFFSSVLLGMLVMERTALAVYIAILFFPVFIYSTVHRFKHDKGSAALSSIAIFVLPAMFLSGVVFYYQHVSLYNYYFLSGYDYASPAYVATIFKDYIIEKIGYSLYVIPMLCIACLVFFRRKVFDKNSAIALWFTIAFPLLLIFTHSLYHGFYTIESLFLVILLASVFPSYSDLVRDRFAFMQSVTPQIYQILLITLLTNTIMGSFVQYQASSKGGLLIAQTFAPWRKFYDKSVDIIMSQPNHKYFAFLFDEANAIFIEHLWFMRHIPWNEIKHLGGMTVHDSYYVSSNLRKNSTNITAKTIADNMIKMLESQNDVIVFAYCSAKDVDSSPAFGSDSKKISMPVAKMETDYLLNSPHWKVISKVDTPRGCVYAYLYTKEMLDQKTKWQDLS